MRSILVILSYPILIYCYQTELIMRIFSFISYVFVLAATISYAADSSTIVPSPDILTALKKYCIHNPGKTTAAIMGTGLLAYGTVLARRYIYIRAIERELASASREHMFMQITPPLTSVEIDNLSKFFDAYRRADSVEIPRYIAVRCDNYIRELPKPLRVRAQKTADDLGITESIFFFETSANTHAGKESFFSVGIEKKELLWFEHKDFLKRHYRAFYHDLRNNFYCALYHELFHIKENHPEKGWQYIQARIRQASLEGQGLKYEDHTKHNEITAELASMYLLLRCKNVNLMSTDQRYHTMENHPTPEEQNRYNRKLHEQITSNPALLTCDYETGFAVVKELAKEYLLEKNAKFAFLFESHTTSSSSS